MRKLLAASTLVFIAGCSVLTPPSEDPVLIKLTELERRLGAIERVVQNQSLVELSQQISALERSTDELRGVAETLEYDAASTADRQRALYADLDSRIAALEAAVESLARPSVMDGGPMSPGQLPVPGGSDSENYQAAFQLIQEQRYDAAEMAFEQFLISFPESENKANAIYWLAESFYVRQQFADALGSFERVMLEHPTHRKAVDALLKVGYCNYELERWGPAREALLQVQTDYPDTTAARLAGQRLDRMETEGV